jgi:cytochrome P450
MATCRAIGLLARARAEVNEGRTAHHRALPLLSAPILESLRLWRTTLLILRQTTSASRWATEVLPPGAGVAIFAPLFHRDDRQLPFANRFARGIRAEDPPVNG